MVKSENEGVVKAFRSVSNIEELLENEGIWSAARLLLKDKPIEVIEALYKKKRQEYLKLTEQFASITLKHFYRDSTFKSDERTREGLADVAVNLHLAPIELQEYYKRLKSAYFVFSDRHYGKTRGVKRDYPIYEFHMLPDQVRQDAGAMISVWRKLPLERLVNIHTSPENRDRLITKIRQYGLSVAITEVRKEYKPIYPNGLYGNW